MSTVAAGDAVPRRSAASTASEIIRTTAAAVDLIALSIWLGGLLMIGAAVAPSAFHVVRAAAPLAGNTSAQNAIAGGIVGASLRIFNDASLFCGAVLIAAAFRLRSPQHRTAALVLAVAAAAAVAITAWQQFGMFPAMDTLRNSNPARFQALHTTYESLAQVQLLLLLIVAAAYARLGMRRTQGEQ